MTESNQSENHDELVIGDFKVSRSAVEQSVIAGPEDIFGLVFKHWKSWAVVIALGFIVTTYQGRINVLEDQVGSLQKIYSSLPEDKALAIGALRSVEDLREGLTVVVEERATELIASEGILRGGTLASERLDDLVEIAAGFEKLWEGSESDRPAIYSVVRELPSVLARSGNYEPLTKVSEGDSKVAFGVASYFLGHLKAEESDAALSSAVSHLRDAYKKLPTSSQVRSDLIAFELALGNAALLRGDRDTFSATYQKWWPQWDELLQSDDSSVTQFRVAKGIAETMVFPLFALSEGTEETRMGSTDFEAALGFSLDEAVELGVTSARKALSLNVDRLPAIVAAAKLDIVLAGILSSSAVDPKLRAQVWSAYQTAAKRFQGISLSLAEQALLGGAIESLTEASNIAVSHGEQLRVGDLVIGQAVVDKLSVEAREALGFATPSELTEE